MVDASALVDLLQGGRLGARVGGAMRDKALHAPAHADAEVLSALGRANRGGRLTDMQVFDALQALRDTPMLRHPLPQLLTGAWARRENIRLADALYVELAEQLDVPLLTTDRRLVRATPRAQLPPD